MIVVLRPVAERAPRPLERAGIGVDCLQLDVGCPDHLDPLFGVVSE
jgi:hypothetical protein